MRVHRILVSFAILAALAVAEDSQPLAAPYATRSTSGAIVVKATPKGVVNGKFRIDVVVDTHSGSLSTLDLQKQSVLRVSAAEYRPLTPVPMSSHHGSGSLLFELAHAPERFELLIAGLPDGPAKLAWP